MPADNKQSIALEFAPREIRRVMNKTGWGAYQAYTRMLNMKRLFGAETAADIMERALQRILHQGC
jgi:hypothetical protein